MSSNLFHRSLADYPLSYESTATVYILAVAASHQVFRYHNPVCRSCYVASILSNQLIFLRVPLQGSAPRRNRTALTRLALCANEKQDLLGAFILKHCRYLLLTSFYFRPHCFSTPTPLVHGQRKRWESNPKGSTITRGAHPASGCPDRASFAKFGY